MRVVRVLAAAALALCGALAAAAPLSVVGEQLYREGRLPSGEPLRGQRQGEPPLIGQDAACVQCHRRSGMGMVEGRIVIPPIGGRFLFQPGKRIAPDSLAFEDATHLPPTPPDRSAYDETRLARAIREGIGADGRTLDYLMPRFDLDDATMHELVAYLRRLPPKREPGLSDSALQIATIITPDADPVARRAMLNVLQRYFAVNNDSYYSGAPQAVIGAPQVRTKRMWNLHVWELKGEPQSWEAQLDQHLKTDPVFAVLSGLSGATWEPVHRFCERRAVPCLLPNVDLPVVAQSDFYPVYYSQGVLLEAGLIASKLSQAQPDADGKARIVQVFRADDIGAAAAAALRGANLQGRTFADRVLKPGDGASELAQALGEIQATDTLVLWLRAADLQALPAPPAGIHAVYASGVMGGLERAPLAAAWRSVTHIAYPYELPQARSLRLGYALGWFHLWRVPVEDERVQVDTFIACSVLTQTLSSMLGEFDRDYLVERIESMLSSRTVNGYYTRLGLAPGQRFASKGGYLVRFSEPSGPRIVADGDWIVP